MGGGSAAGHLQPQAEGTGPPAAAPRGGVALGQLGKVLCGLSPWGLGSASLPAGSSGSSAPGLPPLPHLRVHLKWV